MFKLFFGIFLIFSSQITMAETSADNLLTETSSLTIAAVSTRLSTYNNMTADMAVASASGQKYTSCYTDSSSQYNKIQNILESFFGKKKEDQDREQSESFNKVQKSYDDSIANLEEKLACQTSVADGYHTARNQAQQMSDKIGGPDDQAVALYNSKILSLILSTANAGLMEASEFGECSKALKEMSNSMKSACDLGLMNGGLTVKSELLEAQAAFPAYIKAKEEMASSETNNTKTQAARDRFIKAVNKVASRRVELKAKSQQCSDYLDAIGKSCTSFVKAVDATVSFKSDVGKFQELFGTGKISYLENLLILGIQTAEAAGNPVNVFTQSFGLVPPSSNIASELAPGMAKEIDTYMYTPKKRIIIWSNLEDEALKTAMATKDEIQKVLDYKNKVKKVQDSLDNTTFLKNNIKLESIVDLFISKLNAETKIKQSATDPAPLAYNVNNVKFPCLANLGNSNCQSMTHRYANSGGLSALPSSLKSIGKKFTDLADTISGKTEITPESRAMGKKLADNHAQIEDLLKVYDRKVNEKSKQNFWNKVNKVTAYILNKNNTTPEVFLASIGGVNILPKAILKKSITHPVFAKMATPALAKDIQQIDITAANKLPEGTPLDNTKKYRIKDVNTNSDVSIFELISERYLKSAYHRLVD